MKHPADKLIDLFTQRGDEAYFGEGVSQTAHALQSAELAVAEGAAAPLVVAALLHDVGHLLHSGGEDIAERGIDARHEAIGSVFLASLFGPAVTEPVRLHVAAKRYLCATDPTYYDSLSDGSKRSLALQGGPFTSEEAANFIAAPLGADAVRLRLWDDRAKITGLATRPVQAYRLLLMSVLESDPSQT
ncbi:MAG TPA: HD domain-containing protein [Stellaceae bacterium]|nr:HD domain-containing protein [Stellaceae bacterium]